MTCVIYQTGFTRHTEGRWIGGREEEKERVKEGGKLDREKQREGEEWRMRCGVNVELGRETAVCVCESFSREE